MFTSSLRRATRPGPVAGLLSARPNTPSVPTPPQGFEKKSHNRRHSSSKPPVPPNDGSRDIGAPSSAPSKEVSADNRKEDATEKRSETRVGKRRAAKDNADGATNSAKEKDEHRINLPSVPSTHHLTLNDVHVASLFSLHRPVSVASSFPIVTSPEAFSSIFASRKTSKTQSNEVIYTLSSVLGGLESAVHQHQQASSSRSSSEENELRAAVAQASASNVEPPRATHLDGGPSEIGFNIREIAKRFRPFNTPPAPVPIPDSHSESSNVSNNTSESNAQSPPARQLYSTVLTISESTNPNGVKTYSAHSSPLVRIQEAPSSDDMSEETRNIRDPSSNPLRYMDRVRRRQQDRMYTISVKRQRKLKMKKHKYKKLRKRTKNLRRKLDKN